MQWFKHDTDATMDGRVKKLLLRYGPDGYAIYFHCLELIAGDVSSENITFELEHDAEIIADSLKVKGDPGISAIEKVSAIMRYIVELGLFECHNNIITCMKLAKRLDSSMSSNPKMREIIKARNSHDTVMIPSCKIRLEENRLEEKREEKKETDFSPLPRVENGSNRINMHIGSWNANENLPRYRFNSLTMKPEDISAALRTMTAYSDDEIFQAITNYAKIKSDIDMEPFPVYATFAGFMAGGVEKYADDAKPFDRCRQKQGVDYDEQRRQEARAHLRRLQGEES